MKYDLIIVGMGIAGISAAIYAKNSGLNVLMLEKEMPGGLTNKINTINNYPGLEEISGPDLSLKLFNTINELKIPYKIAEVENIKIEKNQKIVMTTIGNFESQYIILASGRKHRNLGLKKEQQLLGHGISNCALCDGSLYKDKEIAIVGGGNSAVEEAIYLSKIASKIYMIHRREKFTAEETLVAKLKEKKNIEYFWNSKVTALLEKNQKLSGIVVNEEKELKIEGLFLYIGFEANVSYIESLGITDNDGYIKVNKKFETTIPGVYAVGDAIKKEVYQLITAASDGAIAAVNVIKAKENKM